VSDQTKIVTALSKAEHDRILVRGYDLNNDLLGKITFGQMTFLMLVGRLPTSDEVRMIDSMLIVLVDHGMTTGAIAARLTYHSAPEAIQAAVATAILGAGSVHLGSSEYSAKMLQEAFPPDSKAADLDAIAEKTVDRYLALKVPVPGIGHSTHTEGDPRAEKLFRIAREAKVYGRYCDLLQKIGKIAEARRGRRLPVNVTGAIAAISSDMGLPWQMAKTFALLGRALGGIAHIGEEIRRPMARNISSLIKSALVYNPDIEG
jgi:citrate synthase